MAAAQRLMELSCLRTCTRSKGLAGGGGRGPSVADAAKGILQARVWDMFVSGNPRRVMGLGGVMDSVSQYD